MPDYSCEACTFLNKATNAKCEVCERPRPAAMKRQLALLRPSETLTSLLMKKGYNMPDAVILEDEEELSGSEQEAVDVFNGSDSSADKPSGSGGPMSSEKWKCMHCDDWNTGIHKCESCDQPRGEDEQAGASLHCYERGQECAYDDEVDGVVWNANGASQQDVADLAPEESGSEQDGESSEHEFMGYSTGARSGAIVDDDEDHFEAHGGRLNPVEYSSFDGRSNNAAPSGKTKSRLYDMSSEGEDNETVADDVLPATREQGWGQARPERVSQDCIEDPAESEDEEPRFEHFLPLKLLERTGRAALDYRGQFAGGAEWYAPPFISSHPDITTTAELTSHLPHARPSDMRDFASQRDRERLG